MTTLSAFNKEFEKLTSDYIKGINWNTVVWNDGEIEQAGDDLQMEAFRNISDGDLTEWEFYNDSCDARMDFERELQEKWEEQEELRAESEKKA